MKIEELVEILARLPAKAEIAVCVEDYNDDLHPEGCAWFPLEGVQAVGEDFYEIVVDQLKRGDSIQYATPEGRECIRLLPLPVPPWHEKCSDIQ